uniref:Transposase Tnp1/En/Spm-like domain-containing protein n=1 Tax=Arundo donax TaxID=35708 RepID=A0A0A9B0I4_ARUDO
MRTAGRKWKEFKATLKWLYFNVELCDEEVTESQDNRVNDADWKTLMDYWRSPKSQARTEIAKVNRAKLELHHTSGSISYACSKHDLAVELGCPPSRDELFIKTHTRKNGVASAQAQPIINQLKEIVEARPELKERTIQQGDVFAAVCGEMEPRGYVRVMGLGPTPQDVGTPGLKCYTPTRLQMEILARKKAESEKAALEKCLDEMQARMDWWEQREQERVETPRSNVGSNSRDHANTRSDEIDEVGHHDDQGEEEYASADNEYYEEENQNLLGRRHAAAPPIPTRHNDAPRLSHDTLVGKDVILYAMLRSDLPVAKGTIISTNPSTVLGGQILGRQFCEVVVNVVLKRDAILPRPYADMETMADANMMSIAWPYKRLKVSNKASPSSQGTTGSGGRSQLRCS